MRLPHIVVAFFAVLEISLTACSAATFTKIVASGDDAPGFPGLVASVVDSVGNLDNNGVLSYSHRVTGAGVTTANDTVRYIGPIGSPALLYREGNQAATFPSGVSYTAGTRSWIDDNGRLGMQLNLSGTAGGTSTDTATWLYDNGNFAPLFREGDAAPGLPGLAVANINAGQRSILPTSTGKLLHRLVVAGAGVTSANDVVYYYGTNAGDLMPYLREGDAVPDGPAGAVIQDITTVVAQADKVFAIGRMQPGTGGVTTADDTAAWITDGNNDLKLALREGDQVAGATPFASFFSPNEWAFNDNGQLLAYNATLAGPGINGSNDRSILLGGLGAPFTAIVREGDAAPGTGGNLFGNSFGEARFGNDGTVLFLNQMTGPGVTSENDSGLFIGTPGNFSLLAHEGHQAPGFPTGVNFTSFSSSAFTINDVGSAVLLSGVSDGADFNKQVLFATDPFTGEFEPVLQVGDSLEVSPGVSKEVTNLFGTYSHTQQNFNNLNQIVFGVRFADGAEGLYVANLSVPEPATVVLVALGLVPFAAFRRRFQS